MPVCSGYGSGVSQRTGQRARRLRDAPLVLAAIVLVCLPLIVTVVRAGTEGFIPIGDNAIIATRAGDVFTSNSPSLGMTSSLSGYTNGRQSADHPGPLLFWAFAVPYAVSGHSPVGFLAAVLLLQIGSVLLLAFVANRRAGPTLALLALLGAGLIAWSLAGPSLAPPQNPYVTILPFLTYLFLCWTMACGNGWAIAPAIALGSLCVQAHLSYGLVVSLVGLVAVVAYGSEQVRQSHRGERRPRRGWPSWVMPVAVGVTTVACWAPALVQQARSSTPNLSAILSGIGPGGASSHLDPVLYGRIVWPTFGLWPFWARSGGWLQGYGPFNAATTVALFVGLVGLTAWAWRTGRHDLSRLLIIADAAVVAALVTVRSAPETLDPQNFRYLWAIGPFAWSAALVGTLALALARRPLARRGARRVVEPTLLAAIAVVVLLAALHVDPLGFHTDQDAARHTAAVASLTRQLVGRLDQGRTYGMVRHGETALLSIGPGVLRSLEQHGISIHVIDNDVAAYGVERSGTAGLDGSLVISTGASGPGPEQPKGTKVVARFDTKSALRLNEMEPRILKELSNIPRLTLTPQGQKYFELLLGEVAKDPRAGAAIEKTLGEKLTRNALADLLRHPKKLVDSGAADRLLRNGFLGALAKGHALQAPGDVLELIEQYESYRVSGTDSTVVYLVPPGIKVT